VRVCMLRFVNTEILENFYEKIEVKVRWYAAHLENSN
jgi:hypothetical protein